MDNRFHRTSILIGEENVEKLNNSKVIVYGIGGVGSYIVEALARSGVGHIIIVDPDKVDETNINRQIEALTSTIGKYKVDVMKERILDINPNAIVEAYKPEEIEGGEECLIDNTITYVVDAIDTMTNRIKVIVKANEVGVPIISSAGAANKLNPTKFEVSDIYKTSMCPVCRILRKQLKERNIKKLKVVYSKEEPIKVNVDRKKNEKILGSISFVPSVAGLIVAGEVIKDIIKK